MAVLSKREIKQSILIGALLGIVLAAGILLFGQSILNAYYRTVPGRMYSLIRLSNLIVREHVFASQEDDPLEIAYLAYFEEEEAPQDRREIRKAFREEIKADPDAYYTIANLMLSHFDRYSNLSEPELYGAKYPDNEDYEGLGLTISRLGPFIRIASVYPDSEAGRAGFQPGDLICTIGDTDIRTMAYKDAKELLYAKAEEGTTFGVLREGSDALLSLEIKVGSVHIPNVCWEIHGEIGYLNITLFHEKSFIQDVKNAMANFEDAGVNYLVLDMRNNRGGRIIYLESLLNSLVDEEGVLLFSEHYRRSDNLYYSDGKGMSFKDIVVVVDGKTCSSAEVVSGSLKDMGYKLIGETTYGKAVGLTTYDFYGDKLVLATMTLELPKTGNYNEEGIQPDFEVKNKAVPVAPVELLPIDSQEISPESDPDKILALEQRLQLLGYLFVPADRTWDTDTDEALSTFYSALGKPYAQICDAEALAVLCGLTEDYCSAMYPEDTQLQYAYEYLYDEIAAQAA